MVEDERREYGTFATAEDAIAAYRRLVNQSPAEEYRPGMTATQLYDRYTSFGAFVVAASGAAKIDFSARDYAKGRVEPLCAAGR